MNRLTFISGNKKLEFGINNIKYIIGSDYTTKYIIYKVIESNIRGKDSEFADETENRQLLKVNDKNINLKETDFYFVNQFFDIETDLKLGAKSIMFKYLLNKLSQPEYMDQFYTINMFIKSILIEGDDIDEELLYNFNEVIIKTLVKELAVKPMKNGYIAYPEDLNYEEKIIFQLKLITSLTKVEENRNKYLIVDIPYLSDNIRKTLVNIKNLSVIVLINSISKENDISNIMLCNWHCIDFADDNEIYQRINEILNNCYSLVEVKMILNDYINKINTDITSILNERL